MGIRDNIRSILNRSEPKRASYSPTSADAKWFDSVGKPKTIIATGKAGGGKKATAMPRDEKTLKAYWNYYMTEGTIFASINTIAWNTVMVGYHLISDDPDAKAIIQRKFDLMDLDSVLLDTVIYGLVFGDSFLEKVRAKGKDESIAGMAKPKKPKGFISQLKIVDPITMVINSDDYGNEQSYQQRIQGQLLNTLLKPEDIIHFKFFPQTSSPYGISLIGPSVTTIERKMATDETIFNAVQRHTAKYLVKVGDTEHIPPKSAFTQIQQELEDINSKNEIIVPGVIDITTIDERGVQGVSEYFDTFQRQMIVGLLCPEESLGMGTKSTEACYDEKTETLTKDGWKKYIELTNNDEIATYNPTQDAIEYNKPIDDVKEYIYDHDGDMIHFKSQKIDMLVTPNHRMWVNKNPTSTKEKWEFVTAEEIYNSNSHWAIKSRATREELNCSPDSDEANLMSLIGYFVSEGCIDNGNARVRISQKKQESADKIKCLLAELPYRFTERYSEDKGYEWTTYDKEICEQMSKFGTNCYDRHLTREIINKPISGLEYLLDSALDGDGTYDTREGRNNCEYTTTSKQLADDIQEIALRCGYPAHIIFSEDNRENRVGVWRVRINLSDKAYQIITPSMCEKVYYKGKVHCLNVPNHIYITRRNDKSAIQGNTAKVKEIMFERFIKAIQHKLAQRIRIEIINDILVYNGFEPDTVDIRFNSVTDNDEAVKAKWVGNLLRSDMKVFTINEIRAMFDYPPVEGGDELLINQDDAKEDKPKEKPDKDVEEDAGTVGSPPESSAEE